MHLDIKPFSQCKVLVVDDDEIARLTLEAMLEEYFDVTTLSDSSQVLAQCAAEVPDLIVLDVNMPHISGLEVCKELKQSALLEQVPVVFVTGTYDTQSQNACWEAGASDFIGKPVAASTLIHRTQNHLENKLRLEALIKLTYKDSLTGLYNRHYLDEEVVNSLRQSMRESRPFSVLMIDIDLFKQYNDHYGHPQGDECLKQVAQVLQQSLRRPHDVAVRFGGEEFLVIMPYTDASGCEFICKQIMNNLSAANLKHDYSPFSRVTVSIGATTSNQSAEVALETLIADADQALYDAKRAGRNRYQCLD